MSNCTTTELLDRFDEAEFDKDVVSKIRKKNKTDAFALFKIYIDEVYPESLQSSINKAPNGFFDQKWKSLVKSTKEKILIASTEKLPSPQSDYMKSLLPFYNWVKQKQEIQSLEASAAMTTEVVVAMEVKIQRLEAQLAETMLLNVPMCDDTIFAKYIQAKDVNAVCDDV